MDTDRDPTIEDAPRGVVISPPPATATVTAFAPEVDVREALQPVIDEIVALDAAARPRAPQRHPVPLDMRSSAPPHLHDPPPGIVSISVMASAPHAPPARLALSR